MLLALALADNAHEDGTHIFPSVETMAHKSRQSVRAVQVHLRKMLAIGWLQLVKNGRGGRGHVPEYRINPLWLKGAELAPFIPGDPGALKGAESAPFSDASDAIKGADSGTERVQKSVLKGADSCTPYITVLTSSEPNTPLTPHGGQDGGGVAQPETGEGCEVVDGFAKFWNTWPDHPNKQGHETCMRRWRRKRLDRFTEEILADIVARRDSQKWRNGFIESPGKYLKESRWNDKAANGMQLSALGWDDTRAGIESMGVKLGLGPWDQAKWERTGAVVDMFHEYTARVRAALEKELNGKD